MGDQAPGVRVPGGASIGALLVDGHHSRSIHAVGPSMHSSWCG